MEEGLRGVKGRSEDERRGRSEGERRGGVNGRECKE